MIFNIPNPPRITYWDPKTPKRSKKLGKNKLGLSWAKLSHSCVKLIRSFDMLSHLNGLD